MQSVYAAEHEIHQQVYFMYIDKCIFEKIILTLSEVDGFSGVHAGQ